MINSVVLDHIPANTDDFHAAFEPGTSRPEEVGKMAALASVKKVC